jgi:NodT family efflux transporter outer membrane factor (OMF) lipoprotein
MNRLIASPSTRADRAAGGRLRPRSRFLALVAICGGFVASLGGCAAVGPNFLKPAAIVPTDYKEIKGWKLATPRAALTKGDWWTPFGDPELDRLEREVAIANQTVKADEANYRQALALINESRAGLFPVLSFNSSLERSSLTGTTVTAEPAASWAPDIWGLTRRTIEAQEANAETSAANLANATLAAQSALALAYVQVRQADSLADLLAATEKEYQRALEIVQNQYEAGTAAKSDVITEQAQLLSARAAQINVGVARAQNEHAIAVLTGRPPSELSIPHGDLTRRIPAVPVSLPSALLERRPDIAAAEETMRQANALIGVAVAAYYPTISLTGSAGYQGNPFAGGLSPANPVWTFGLSLAQPLFNGGLTDAQVEAARQTYLSDVATYRQTVLTGFQQVEDQLAAIRVLSSEVRVQADAVRVSRQAVDIALNEYRAGTQNFTTVVTAQATALSAEQSELASWAELQTAAVDLIVALGGGWSEERLPDVDAQAAAKPSP